MAVTHKGAISFGLVHIPVALYTATQDNDIRFNQLCKEDHSRIRYKKVCAHCGKEVRNEDIVKGFEYEKDKFVVMTDEDFESAKTEKDRSIHILHFTDLAQIRPIYYEKTYHVAPEAGGDKAYELLRQAMKEEGKVAVAKSVIGAKEKLIAIIPTDEGMLLETLYFADEIKALPKAAARTEPKPAELEMAKTLVGTMSRPFEPELYQDEYQKRLREIIEKKISGQEIAAPAGRQEDNVIDIMEALRASIEQSKKGEGGKAKAKEKKAGKKAPKGA